MKIYLLLYSLLVAQCICAQSFQWPEGKRAALSLSFDDARLSNVDIGLPLFKKHGVQVTYYVIPEKVKERLPAWKKAVEDGHEIGNHTLIHPCSGNFEWAREKALEQYNLADMRQELLQANAEIKELLGVEARSFAYTCGQTYVGRGVHTRSMVPVIAELFDSGRGWLDEDSNDPLFVDMAQLMGVEMDGKQFEDAIKPLIENAAKTGRWLVLAGHEIGTSQRQTTEVEMLEKLIAYAKNPENGIWLAPVGTVAKHIEAQRSNNRKKLTDALSLCATFDQGYPADYARGNAQLFTAPSYGKKQEGTEGMSSELVELASEKGLFGNALHFKAKGKPVIYYQTAQNMIYSEENWNGSISLWLSVNPEKDLAPGFTDPIQITDSGYNDAGFWVDFSDKNPRDFRMGLYGDLTEWNPENIPPDKNPAFLKRLLPAKDRPFDNDSWTHVVISFSGINTKAGSANFYINGRHQGERKITEPFTWELAKSKIFLGLNYVGLLDEVAIFDRAISSEEVLQLYNLPKGLKSLLELK